CSVGGSVTVIGSGGEGDISYSIDGTTFVTDGTFDGLSAGDYQVTAEDGNGCQVTTSVSIEAAQGSISLEVAVTETSCGEDNGTLTITASGADGAIEYSIDGSTFTSDNVFNNLAFGEYTIIVRSGECEATRSVEVRPEITLSGTIMPIVSSNCAVSGCHANAVSPRLNTAQDIISAAGKVQARTMAKTMPPSGPLSDQQIEQIKCWVEEGALNN
ncbi:MAG: hypothetical protein AAFO69_10975, partial [Bacteroidota bacterium]